MTIFQFSLLSLVGKQMWIQDFPDDGEGGANPKDGSAN